MKSSEISRGLSIWFTWSIVLALNGDDVTTQQIPRPPYDANEQPLSDTGSRSSGESF
jgi:hypothetical protein